MLPLVGCAQAAPSQAGHRASTVGRRTVAENGTAGDGRRSGCRARAPDCRAQISPGYLRMRPELPGQALQSRRRSGDVAGGQGGCRASSLKSGSVAEIAMIEEAANCAGCTAVRHALNKREQTRLFSSGFADSLRRRARTRGSGHWLRRLRRPVRAHLEVPVTIHCCPWPHQCRLLPRAPLICIRRVRKALKRRPAKRTGRADFVGGPFSPVLHIGTPHRLSAATPG
jgi:hypothetical protein